MDIKWRISCLGVVLIFTLVVCSTVVMLGATRSATEAQQTQVAAQHGNQNQSGDVQVQILGRRFDDAELAQGHALYKQYCAACHGIVGQGQLPSAPLEPDATGRIGAPPHDETGHSWHHSDVLLIRYVMEGGFSDLSRFYPMPSFGAVLTEEQAQFVIAHIKSMWTDEQRASQQQLTQAEQNSVTN